MHEPPGHSLVLRKLESPLNDSWTYAVAPQIEQVPKGSKTHQLTLFSRFFANEMMTHDDVRPTSSGVQDIYITIRVGKGFLI